MTVLFFSFLCRFSLSPSEEHGDLWELGRTLQQGFFTAFKVSNHQVGIIKAGVVEFYLVNVGTVVSTSREMVSNGSERELTLSLDRARSYSYSLLFYTISLFKSLSSLFWYVFHSHNLHSISMKLMSERVRLAYNTLCCFNISLDYGTPGRRPQDKSTD